MFAALNPFQEDKYFLVNRDGSCSYQTTMATKEESTKLHEITSDYMRMRAKRDGTTFSHPFTKDGVTTQITITPDSYQETGRMRSLVDSWIERRNMPVRKEVVFLGAVVGGAGIISKLSGNSAIRAMSVAASTGVGAAVGVAFAFWHRG